MPLYFGNGTFSSINVISNALGQASPSNHHLTAWSTDPYVVSTGNAMTNGLVKLQAVYPASSASITKIYWWISTAGATPTANQNHIGIYDSAGNKLASTIVDSAISSAGLKTTTISSSAVQAGQMYWVAALFNATTPPTLAWAPAVALTGGGSAANVGLGAADARAGNGASAQTTLAASFVPSTIGQSSAFWCAIGP